MRRDFKTDGDIKVDLEDIESKWDNRGKEYGEKEPRWAKMAVITHHADDGFNTRPSAYFCEIVTIEVRRVTWRSTVEWEVAATSLNESIKNDYHKDGFHGEHVATRGTKKEAMAVAKKLLKRQWALENKRYTPQLFVPSFKTENKTYENKGRLHPNQEIKQ